MGSRRSAQVFFYLNDVADGGETAFPRAGGGEQPRDFRNCHQPGWLTVRPQKRKVMIFYSMLPSGEFDHYSLHAGCDVGPNGTKWGANYWCAPFIRALGVRTRRRAPSQPRAERAILARALCVMHRQAGELRAAHRIWNTPQQMTMLRPSLRAMAHDLTPDADDASASDAAALAAELGEGEAAAQRAHPDSEGEAAPNVRTRTRFDRF
jgi:hypothetical protein